MSPTEKNFKPFYEKYKKTLQSQKIFFRLICHDNFSISSAKNFVSKEHFGYPILDIFFVHFEKVKTLFIF